MSVRTTYNKQVNQKKSPTSRDYFCRGYFSDIRILAEISFISYFLQLNVVNSAVLFGIYSAWRQQEGAALLLRMLARCWTSDPLWYAKMLTLSRRILPHLHSHPHWDAENRIELSSGKSSVRFCEERQLCTLWFPQHTFLSTSIFKRQQTRPKSTAGVTANRPAGSASL